MAGSDTGYAYTWVLYTGKEGDVVRDLGSKVVKSLTEPHLVGHILLTKFLKWQEIPLYGIKFS
jgi:hypothetical protein